LLHKSKNVKKEKGPATGPQKGGGPPSPKSHKGPQNGGHRNTVRRTGGAQKKKSRVAPMSEGKETNLAPRVTGEKNG